MKTKCMVCNALATWIYMPSDSNGNYCDDCVPRGCSCNIDCDEEGRLILDETGEEFVQYKDEQGRLLPCCEYDFFEEGIEEDEECNS